MLKQIARLAGPLLAALLFPLLAGAQSASRAVISSPQLDQFPTITLYLDVRDTAETFVSSLSPADVVVLEDGAELPVAELAELRPGLQFVLAVNTATSFAIRDQQGATRFDYLSQNLQAWANFLEGEALNDFSLVTPAGTALAHSADPVAWAEALAGYQPDFETASPTLDILSLGIDLAADPLPEFGMARAVLFITSILDSSFNEALSSLAQRAAEANVRVFVWQVDSPALFNSDAALVLQDLARQTGGQFFAFSGIEPIPDLGAQLNAARGAYRLSYASRVSAGGAHQVAVRVQKDDWQVLTTAHTFDLRLLPPNVAFVSPPAQIQRAVPQGKFELADLQPASYPLEVLVEFPDGLPRQLASSTLFVNGEPVAENLSPPFDSFVWDLSGYLASQDLILRVEVVDELGLSAATIDTPVMLNVTTPPSGLSALLARINPMVVGSVVIVAGLVLLLVLVMAGRIHPRPLGARRRARTSANDPVTQPVREATSPSTRRRLPRLTRRIPTPHLPWASRREEAEALAYLVPLGTSGEARAEDTRPITQPSLTFGSDAAQVTLVLDDPAVEKLHARLWRSDSGAFLLADEDTVAGTWVNYAPVSKEGSPLQHGDLIHIGRVGFRFTLRSPENPRRPLIIRQENGK